MSFRSRVFSRNSPVTAQYVPVYKYQDTGLGILAVPVSHDPDKERLFDDTTFDKVLDSGLSPRQFTPSPDSCLINKELAVEFDASSLISELQADGVINRQLEFVKPVADVVKNVSHDTDKSIDNNN